jgi:uncharacterized iron-regulated membrane protein
LFAIAWSGVALNLGEIYDPVMSVLVGPSREEPEPPELSQPKPEPGMAWRDAYALAQRLMRAEADKRGFQVLSERTLRYSPEHGLYTYSVESSLDVSARLADTYVSFDGDTGQPRTFSARGGLSLRDTITTWLIALHFGTVRAGGLAYRILLGLTGIAVALLSVSGVWIWWKKRDVNRKYAGKAGAGKRAQDVTSVV